jgi:uncharacterized protein
MFAVLSFFFFVSSLRTDMVLLAIFALITIGLVLLSVGAGTTTPDLTKAGDWVTPVFAVLAWYCAAGESRIVGGSMTPPRIKAWQGNEGTSDEP